MSDSEELICWNCSKRSTAGTCVHCGALLSNPEEVSKEQQEQEAPPKRIFEIRYQNEIIAQIEYDSILGIVEKNFVIADASNTSRLRPQFVVERPADVEFQEKFEQIVADSALIVDGLKPLVREVENQPHRMLISFAYIQAPEFPSFWFTATLLLFTFLSTVLAGIYNFDKLQEAIGNTDLSGLKILGVYFNLDSFSFGMQFAAVLLFIIFVKDLPFIIDSLRFKRPDLLSFLIPTPPVFELGNFGSILHQLKIHKNRRSLFNRTYWSAILAWLVSAVIVVMSLSLSELNPTGAANYAVHSVLANGSKEPVILTGLAMIANNLGLADINLTSNITANYVFNPITLAGIAGLYISGINLLPCSHFNGGFATMAVFGRRVFTILTYVVILAFISVHWLLAAFVFALNEFLQSPQVLDEITPPPLYSKIFMILGIILGVLSFPIPISFLF